MQFLFRRRLLALAAVAIDGRREGKNALWFGDNLRLADDLTKARTVGEMLAVKNSLHSIEKLGICEPFERVNGVSDPFSSAVSLQS